jgi:hypothetical protein
MAVYEFSDEQVEMARHALGLDRGKKIAFRNFYRCSSSPDWDDLVRRGFATCSVSAITGIDCVYRLSKEAMYFFLNTGERLSDDLREHGR